MLLGSYARFSRWAPGAPLVVPLVAEVAVELRDVVDFAVLGQALLRGRRLVLEDSDGLEMPPSAQRAEEKRRREEKRREEKRREEAEEKRNGEEPRGEMPKKTQTSPRNESISELPVFHLSHVTGSKVAR